MRASLDELRCAEWTRREDPDPIGTAPRFDELIVVEVPLPWPADVGELPELAPAGGVATTCRVMTAMPAADRPPGERLITVHRRDGRRCRFSGVDALVPADGVRDALAALAAGEDLGGRPAPHEVLVCSHGSRDRCCGSKGTRFHAEASARWPDVRIRRVSHLGGHRFAPTGMSLPDGRLWAYLDVGILDTVIGRTGSVDPVLRHYRGSPALNPPFQVLERIALGRFGWRVSEWPVIGADEVGGRHVLRLGAPYGVASVAADVFTRREVPVLTCGSAPEAAVKSCPELAARDVVITRG